MLTQARFFFLSLYGPFLSYLVLTVGLVLPRDMIMHFALYWSNLSIFSPTRSTYNLSRASLVLQLDYIITSSFLTALGLA